MRTRSRHTLFRMIVTIAAFASAGLAAAPAFGAITSVTPSTWNIIGLDSNSPGTGPYRFPVGAKVCGDTPGATTTATLTWDAGGTDNGTYIYLRAGSANPVSITFGTVLGSDGCPGAYGADAYFEVEVNRVAAAFNKTRRYNITVGGFSTPWPRELYVEKLVSQARNYITNVELNGATVPAGGSMTMMVGNTYTLKLYGGTATQGYNQFEQFINFPNTIFQVLSVSTDYSANTSPYVSSTGHKYLYADACRWENDPNSPNTRSCWEDWKSGGSNVVTTYTVKILSGAGSSQTLNTLLYDFSGSSFHYNADFTTGARIVNIVGPSSVTIRKTFSPRSISPGGASAMTFRLANPTSETFTNVNVTDTLLGGLQVAGTPGVTYTGCGSGAFSSASAGTTSLSFSGGTLAPNSICTITVNVTAATAGTYPNTTGNLYIKDTVDTGNTGSDTLTASTAPACIPNQPLATWIMPTTGQGSGGPPPPYTTKAANVATATASVSAGMTTSINADGLNSWAGRGFPKTGAPTGDSTPHFQFAVDTSKYSSAMISLDFKADPNWGGGGTDIPAVYIFSSTTGANGSFSQIYNNGTLSTVWQSSGAQTAAATGSSITYFRIAARGSTNTNADLLLDNITFTGCGIPTPPPTITKSFLSNPIVKGGTSVLRFTINNTSAGNQALTGVAFTDVLPAGLSVADATTSACNGTNNLTRTAATRTIALAGGTLASGASCTMDVTVTGATEGQYENISGYVSSAESGENKSAGGYATASLTVIAPPSIAQSFSPTTIFTGNTSTLTFAITNPNLATLLNGIGFTDTLSAGLTVATSGPTAVCGGSLSTTSPGTISFTGGSLAANSNCSFSVTVTGVASGNKTSTSTVVTSTQGGNGTTSSAAMDVNTQTPSIDLIKQVGTSDTGPWSKYVAVAEGSSVYYRFSVYNSGDTALYNIGITETAGTISPTCSWPEPLAVGDTATCVSAAVTAASGSNMNTAYATAQYPNGGAVYNSANSSATYATMGLTISKSAAETSFTATGSVLNYSYVVTNSGFATLTGPASVADDKTSVTCPALSTVGDLDNYFDPAEAVTCTATYTVTAADVTAKQVTNTASATVGGATSPTASKTVPLAPPDFTAQKANNTSGQVTAGGSFVWTLTVANGAAAGTALIADGQVLLQDDLPDAGAAYVAGAVTKAGATGTITCAIASNVLTCSASGAVMIPPRLQGTLSVTNGSDAVTGTGTAFTTQLTAGSVISISSVSYTVASISSDTALTLTANYSGATAAGLTIPGSFSVPVTVTVTAPAGSSLVNPKSGGICRAEPGEVVAEADETNNYCADTVLVVSLSGLTIVKSVQVYSDPVNGVDAAFGGSGSAKVIPGAEVIYTVVVTNTGAGAIDSDTVVIADMLPADTILCVENACSNPPVTFSCSVTPACGLTYDYAADVSYFNASDGSHTPAPDGAGYDVLARKVRINPKGVLNGAAGAPYPAFTLTFKAKVQ